MEILDIDTVQPGRELARAVFSGEGTLIFPPGERLTNGHIKTLKQWGVQSVAVNPVTSAPVPEQTGDRPEDVLQALRDMLMERFRLQDMTDPHVQAIFTLAAERQGRVLLSKAGKINLGGKSAPAFQTARPSQPNMKVLIESSHRMGTLPMVFHRLVELINNPYARVNDIAEIIAMDPALAARLLRLVNSPFYGLAHKIDSISRAVVLVGARQLVMLAMGATLVTAFRGVPVSLVNMQSFWSHSISCGAAARLIARHADISQPESFFVAGLLHDIARLLIYTQLPEHALYILTEARRRNETVHDLEFEALGFTHEELGAELLYSWNCPDELIQRVKTHHTPVTLASSAEEAVLPAANMLSQALGYGSSGEIDICPLSPLAWSKLNIPPEALIEHGQRLDDNVRELRAMFSGVQK